MSKGIIHVLANDGSPIGVTEKSIFGEDGRAGVGGAELAILTLCKGWHDAGYEVVFFNDPKMSNGSCFEHRRIDDFHPHDNRDILINFRSPSPEKVLHAKGKKIWFSCDQMTIGDYRSFAPMVEKIVTISPFHSKYFQDMYGINNSIAIDLPVRTWEYERNDIQKVSHRCIFTSIPDRGLMQLHAAWPRIVKEVPDATLVITSDWRLWVEWANEEMTKDYRLAYSRQPNVTYLGAVNRTRLIEEQLKAELQLYPCVYDELFCISVAESQVAGVYPITSDCGAVKTTNMGTVLSGNVHSPEWMDKFVETAVMYLKDEPNLIHEHSKMIQHSALNRFSLEVILEQWEKEVFNG